MIIETQNLAYHSLEPFMAIFCVASFALDVVASFAYYSLEPLCGKNEVWIIITIGIEMIIPTTPANL